MEVQSNSRIKMVEGAPKVPPKGYLNAGLQELRTMGDSYVVEPKYLSYILSFREEWCPPQMIERKTGILRQTYFQPAAAVPNKCLVSQIRQNLIKFGCHPKDDYPRFTIDAKFDYQHIDAWVHIVLGVLDIEELYEYDFSSEEEIESIRVANLKKAEELNRRWGPFFWNVHWPPMPTEYSNGKGEFTLSEPMLTDWKSPLFSDLRKRDQHGVEVDEGGVPVTFPDRYPFNQMESFEETGKRKKSKKRTTPKKRKQVKSRDLFSFGFTPVSTDKKVKKKA